MKTSNGARARLAQCRDKVESMTKAPKKNRWYGAGRVAFLAQLEQFRGMVEAGYPLAAIYREHGARLGIGYIQFTRYIAKYILRRHVSHEPATGTSTQSGAPALNREPAVGDQPGKGASTRKRAFEYDPEAGRNRDDLI